MFIRNAWYVAARADEIDDANAGDEVVAQRFLDGRQASAGRVGMAAPGSCSGRAARSASTTHGAGHSNATVARRQRAAEPGGGLIPFSSRALDERLAIDL